MAIVGQILNSPESGMTRYLFTNSTFEYSPLWVNNNGNDMISNKIGDTIKFNFYGDALYLLVYSYSNRGKMLVSIDGAEAIEYNANTGSSSNNSVAYIASELKEKWHDVIITSNPASGSLMSSFRGIDTKGAIAKYDPSVTREKKRMILKNPITNKNYSLSDNTLIHLPNASNKNMLLFGMEQGKEIQLDVPFTKHKYVVDNQDGTQTITDEEVEPFSVYDYISETPSVVVYTDLAKDIIVSTATELFDIYDEFGDSVEVLYYTDDESLSDANLIVDANWSPIDELDGDFEVVTWTDEEGETAKKKLEFNALPVPQFVYPVTVKSVKNGLLTLFAKDLSNDSKVRFLLTPNNTTWYTWKQDNFVPVVLTNENIMNEGLTTEQLNTFSPTQLEAWTQTSVNIGVFLADDVRGDNVSKVSEIGYSTELYTDTPKVEDINFYILNTTATINVELNGLTLTGQVDDADMTRVQYRVILNDVPYYPDNGAFTPLSAPPLNIDIAFRSNEIKIGDWNTVRVEFQDSFGTMDYWEAKFVGQYAGLMFQDESGNYYSSDIGEVLQYLDFGQILTGQVSIVHEVKVENTYGFDLTDVKIAVNTNQFAQGLSVQLGLDPENMQSIKALSLGDLADTASTSFFIRLASSIDAIPNESKTFNIVATANRKITRN